MRLLEPVGPPQRLDLRQLVDDVLLGLAVPAELLEHAPGLVGVRRLEHPQRVDALGQVVDGELAVVRGGAVGRSLGGGVGHREPENRRSAGRPDRVTIEVMVVTACPLDCPDGCTLEVTVDGGRITRIDAAPGNPITDGWICAKVRKHGRSGSTAPTGCSRRWCAPGRRARASSARPRGTRRSTWSPRRMRARRRRARARPAWCRTRTTRRPAVLARRAARPAVPPPRRLGVEHTICAATAGQAYADTFGGMLAADPRDVVHSELVVVWGANPSARNTHFPPLVTQAARDGAEVVVVDPRRTPMAARADLHLAVRPGTDVVLALAVAAYLDARGPARPATSSPATSRASTSTSTARAVVRSTGAAEVCGLAADDIAAFADARGRPARRCCASGWGLERNRNGGSACRAVLALPLLCGHFGALGLGRR